MASISYYVVVPFVRDEDRLIVPGKGKEAPNPDLARRRAQAIATAPGNVGAIAFSRTGDPATGEFQDGQVIAEFGEVDRGALSS